MGDNCVFAPTFWHRLRFWTDSITPKFNRLQQFSSRLKFSFWITLYIYGFVNTYLGVFCFVTYVVPSYCFPNYKTVYIIMSMHCN